MPSSAALRVVTLGARLFRRPPSESVLLLWSQLLQFLLGAVTNQFFLSVSTVESVSSFASAFWAYSLAKFFLPTPA
jgi:hypothetical protein